MYSFYFRYSSVFLREMLRYLLGNDKKIISTVRVRIIIKLNIIT